MAFVDYVRGKKFSYTITPKGEQEQDVPLILFRPHFVLGTISALGLIAALYLGHTSALLFFFAILNTVLMYSFVIYALTANSAKYIRSFGRRSVTAEETAI